MYILSNFVEKVKNLALLSSHNANEACYHALRLLIEPAGAPSWDYYNEHDNDDQYDDDMPSLMFDQEVQVVDLKPVADISTVCDICNQILSTSSRCTKFSQQSLHMMIDIIEETDMENFDNIVSIFVATLFLKQVFDEAYEQSIVYENELEKIEIDWDDEKVLPSATIKMELTNRIVIVDVNIQGLALHLWLNIQKNENAISPTSEDIQAVYPWLPSLNKTSEDDKRADEQEIAAERFVLEAIRVLKSKIQEDQ
tara:strand:- start:251 stop:1012 length:762 start_codon:yes stop_codon:yes gene_type:complete